MKSSLLRSNEAAGLLSQALKTHDFPASYLTELINLLGINLGESAQLTTQQQSLLQHLLYSLSKQVPVEYIVGEAVFFNRRFAVNRDVLIPRFDSEELILLSLDTIATISEPVTVIDVGTGSGALIITLALELQKRGNTTFLAIDISPAALLIAEQNAKLHGTENLISFQLAETIPLNTHNSPLIPQTEYIHIVTNPPYVSPSDYTSLPKSVKDYEPELALRAQPSFLTKIVEYIELLKEHHKQVTLAIEYNDAAGIARWHSLRNPRGQDILDLV